MNTTEMQKQAAFDRGFQIRLQQLAAGELEKSASFASNLQGLLRGGAKQVGPTNFAGRALLGTSRGLTAGRGEAARLTPAALGFGGMAAGAGGAAAFDQGADAYKRRQMANMGLADRLRAAFALITNPSAAASQVY